jgi:DNA-binding beta-propeller fold protein YncE
MWRGGTFCLVVLAVLFPKPILAQEAMEGPGAPAFPGPTQRAAAYANAPDIPYDSVPNFLKLPAGDFIGEVAGVARNSKGHIFVFTRAGETLLKEFDQEGNYVHTIGEGFYNFALGQSLKIDPQDNMWTIDQGTNTLTKFNSAGQMVMMLGRKDEADDGRINASPRPGVLIAVRAPGPYWGYNRPTDVAWDAAGNIFVADGFENSRIAKYDKIGLFVKTTGVKGAAPGQFNVPHTIAVDAKGNVYVGDLGNRRIQIFDNDLKFRKVIDNVGAAYTICITPGSHQYLYSSNSNPPDNDSRSMAVSGEIYKMELDGTVLGKFGKAGKQLKEFGTTKSIDCRVENELLVGEITNYRVQKIILHPQK